MALSFESKIRRASPRWDVRRWSLVALYLFVVLFVVFYPDPQGKLVPFKPILLTISACSFALFHCFKRYGRRATLALYVFASAVSLSLENISIATGFPFGFYHYVNFIGPKILNVPILVTPVYFAIAYICWIVACVLCGQFEKKLSGKAITLVPVVAMSLFTMWAIGLEVDASQVLKLWVWKYPGEFFGVPVACTAGWALTTLLIFIIFAFYLLRYEKSPTKENAGSFASKAFWLECVAMFAITALWTILKPVVLPDAGLASAALVTVFTMMFAALIATIDIQNNKALQ